MQAPSQLPSLPRLILHSILALPVLLPRVCHGQHEDASAAKQGTCGHALVLAGWGWSLREAGSGAGSVDLISVAQAYHWLDHAHFAHSARQVLRAGGVVAAWCYGLPRHGPLLPAPLLPSPCCTPPTAPPLGLVSLLEMVSPLQIVPSPAGVLRRGAALSLALAPPEPIADGPHLLPLLVRAGSQRSSMR